MLLVVLQSHAQDFDEQVPAKKKLVELTQKMISKYPESFSTEGILGLQLYNKRTIKLTASYFQKYDTIIDGSLVVRRIKTKDYVVIKKHSPGKITDFWPSRGIIKVSFDQDENDLILVFSKNRRGIFVPTGTNQKSPYVIVSRKRKVRLLFDLNSLEKSIKTTREAPGNLISNPLER